MPSPTGAATYMLRRATIEHVLDDNGWTQERLADEIGVHRVHFNRLLNGRRPLTRPVRRKLMDCRALRGIPLEDLWDREEPGARST